MKRVPFFLPFLLTLLPVYGQESADQKPPEGPLLSRSASPSQWVITIESITPPKPPDKTSDQASNSPPAADASASDSTRPVADAPAKPTIITVTKSASLVLEQTQVGSGASFETWHVKNWLISGSEGRWFVCSPPPDTFNRTSYAKTDFAGFDWISLKNYSGKHDVAGKHCYVFKDKVVIMDPQQIADLRSELNARAVASHQVSSFDENSLKVDVEADIDMQTRLPVALTYKTLSGEAKRSYIFKAPDGALSLPPDVAQLLKKYDEQQRRMSVGIAPI